MLTVGMATRGEPDSVYFTLQALHANHPRVPYLVVDNTPERCKHTEDVTRAVGGRYLHRPDLTGTSAPRDAVMRLAETPWVMCIDSHVIFETGAINRTLNYIADHSHRDSRDLHQGPLIGDDGQGAYSHWTQPTAGLWGEWATDLRVLGSQPFEIPMLGLGCFLSRKDAWLGFNRAFNGFGGEEGYLHQKYRNAGAKTLLLPWLRWRHKFRDVGGFTPPPYPHRTEDHVWNLLVGHREVGVSADAEIRQFFAGGIGGFEGMQARADAAVAAGPPKRMRLLGIWYSDNTAPTLERSLGTVATAVQQTMHHDVAVVVCPWRAVAGSYPGVQQIPYTGEHRRGYDTILRQMGQAVGEATFDGVVFLEHDVLYPEDYFDRMGDGLATGAPVVSNLDYIGLCSSGWQSVRERHEPLHQLCLRYDVFAANYARAVAEAASGSCILEPDHDGDRSAWHRIQPKGLMPSVHINHEAGRLTSHGEVCYAKPGTLQKHGHWGDAATWYPGPVAAAAAGCGSCGHAPATPESLDAWFKAASVGPSDFHEHMGVLRDLAASVPHATEVSAWHKPADIALAHASRFRSISAEKPTWPGLKKLLGTRFETGGGISPTDLLFLDTGHDADTLMRQLLDWEASVSSYIAVHCTETYGEVGDSGGPGVLHALRTFCQKFPEWVVKAKLLNNHGLVVLSKREEDVKEKPALWRQAISFTKAKAKHLAAGLPMVDDATLEARLGECSLCEFRALDACSACGCPIEAKTPLATETCPKGKW